MSKNTSRARSISFYASILLSISALLLLERSVTAAAAAPPPVKAWEEQLVIPTYLIGPPDPNPQFYFGGQSQGAEHRIYPYPAYDNLTTEKVNKTYKMVYLENEYVKVGILPEIGGRIFEAIDKTNGYNFFYRQHVIKPALISILGAWISGGVEWDVPHHHRATSFLPVQYKIEEDADGSKTVWVGELELRDRMRWAVGTTLHPGKSYLDVSFRMINRTPLPTSMLCFSNVAVHVDDTYQVIFPPSTQHGTYHSKRDFTTWPIATTRYNGADFTAGVDISWYKNHYNSNSVFAWNYQDDFLAGQFRIGLRPPNHDDRVALRRPQRFLDVQPLAAGQAFAQAVRVDDVGKYGQASDDTDAVGNFLVEIGAGLGLPVQKPPEAVEADAVGAHPGRHGRLDRQVVGPADDLGDVLGADLERFRGDPPARQFLP